MKIEVEESDKQEICARVVTRLAETVYADVKQEVLKLCCQDALIAELRSALRVTLANIVSEHVLDDGRSLRQYAEDMLTRKDARFNTRSRIQQLIDQAVSTNAQAWFTDIFDQNKDQLKEEMARKILQLTLESLIAVKRP